jgi:hypothetical protein
MRSSVLQFAAYEAGGAESLGTAADGPIFWARHYTLAPNNVAPTASAIGVSEMHPGASS